MKKSKFTEQQIAFALQQAENGTTVAEVCRKMGIVGREAAGRVRHHRRLKRSTHRCSKRQPRASRTGFISRKAAAFFVSGIAG